MWIEFVKEEDFGEETIIDKKAFNSTMTEVYKGDDLSFTIALLFSQMKTQIQNPKLIESKFKIKEILSMDVNFHKLKLTRGSLYIE